MVPPRDVQLIFDLGHEEATGLADFVPAAANQDALDFLLSWPGWPHPATVLAGPSGSGKSHLARIWASHADAEIVSATTGGLEGLGRDDRCRFVVEDCDGARGALDERGLFHLFNHCLEQGGALLLTSAVAPSRLGVSLADLVSRLRAATLVEIKAPDESLIEAVLVKLFADRQLEVGPEVTGFAVARMERSLSAARELVARIDRLSLEETRRVTRPLVARALAEMSPSDTV